jgi:hypothetical protein
MVDLKQCLADEDKLISSFGIPNVTHVKQLLDFVEAKETLFKTPGTDANSR